MRRNETRVRPVYVYPAIAAAACLAYTRAKDLIISDRHRAKLHVGALEVSGLLVR